MAHYLTMFIIVPLYFNPCGVTKIARKLVGPFMVTLLITFVIL